MLSLISILLSFSIASAAEKLKVAVLDYPPMGIVQGDKKSGVFPDIAAELMKKTDSSFEVISIGSERVDRIVTELPAILFMFRNKQREALGFKWIGSVGTDHLCFLTLKPHPPLKNMDEVKAASAIGVNAGSSTEKRLKEMGLTNVTGAPTSSGNIRKLTAKKIDAWFVSSVTGKYFSSIEGVADGGTECTGDYGKVDMVIAATSLVPDDVVEKLKSEFEKIKAAGTVEKLIEKYTKNAK